MRVTNIVPEFVTSFPEQLESGLLYVSARFSTAAHLCACGCGREVVTPLSPAQWTMSFDGTVSMWPSIGNWAFPCHSHYIIDRGTIRWARKFTEAEIHRNQVSDGRLLDGSKAGSVTWWDRARRRFLAR